MFCNRLKEFLQQHLVEFIDRDITADGTAMSELENLGVMTTPVTVIDVETVVGYDVNH